MLYVVCVYIVVVISALILIPSEMQGPSRKEIERQEKKKEIEKEKEK